MKLIRGERIGEKSRERREYREKGVNRLGEKRKRSCKSGAEDSGKEWRNKTRTRTYTTSQDNI